MLDSRPKTATHSTSSTLPTPSPDSQYRSLKLSQSISDAVLPNPSQAQTRALHDFVSRTQSSAAAGRVGYDTLDNTLGATILATSLTYNLLDAAERACCSRLPAIHALTTRIPFFKTNLDKLVPSDQLAVAVLVTLGARVTPHSALLGVSSEALGNGTATPDLYLSAGARREKACRALESRAAEISWAGGILSNVQWDNVQSLAGLTQLLIFEEVKPHESRFRLRNAVGMYIDLLSMADHDPGIETRRSVGMSLFIGE